MRQTALCSGEHLAHAIADGSELELFSRYITE
jgi:hypothetical protein